MGLVVAALVAMMGVGQVPEDWWRLTKPVSFHWNEVSGSRQAVHHLRLAWVLAQVQSCDRAVEHVKTAEKLLRDKDGRVWFDVAHVYLVCMRWLDADRAVRRSGVAMGDWPAWARQGAATALLAQGRPWEAHRIWSSLIHGRQGPKFVYRVLSALSALEAGFPGRALADLSGKGTPPMRWRSFGWVVRALILLVDGRVDAGLSLLASVWDADPGLAELEQAGFVFTGCFSVPVVGALLLRANGCGGKKQLMAQAAVMRSGHCAPFAASLEAAGRWRPKTKGRNRCEVLAKAVARLSKRLHVHRKARSAPRRAATR